MADCRLRFLSGVCNGDEGVSGGSCFAGGLRLFRKQPAAVVERATPVQEEEPRRKEEAGEESVPDRAGAATLRDEASEPQGEELPQEALAAPKDASSPQHFAEEEDEHSGQPAGATPSFAEGDGEGKDVTANVAKMRVRRTEGVPSKCKVGCCLPKVRRAAPSLGKEVASEGEEEEDSGDEARVQARLLRALIGGA
jgi:hypothetical protein